ncbi:hypothetical protein ANANG_G00179780 [Anguilla anguilla]|uniref:Glycosyltransferase 2-like domain-containing protein n=1 Tax=Anguilla anguilla TaxID=7936 RepID=A0A9D3M513_ANGAN|nr:hypothetical protein ANANG_G00179780 [Anguilla anguilla]
MRVRLSRRLGLLAKACLLLSVMLLAYFLLERSGTSSPGSEEDGGGGRSLRERQFSDAEESREQLARPKKLEDESVERYAINIYVSDRISLHRHILDNRMHECRAKKFNYRSLPTTSVVIAFYNEAWSTLLRTIHSVLEATPAVLLKEIILIDDYSDKAYLKSQLAQYISGLERVRLVRTKKREGLVRARLIGATFATGDVLTFLDCHCECVPGWIEPLLQRINEDESTIVCPVIDTIDWNTFEYYMQTDEPMVGGFDWRLTFQWHAVPEVDRQRRTSRIDPIRSPTMAGGLFAVSKSYFEFLGTYDMGMEVWGGENLELSFRVWQCGGSLEVHPCSHVGHVFPKKAPYARPNFLQNTVRAAEVWMDTYKQHFYNRNPGPKGIVRGHLREARPQGEAEMPELRVVPEKHLPGPARPRGPARLARSCAQLWGPLSAWTTTPGAQPHGGSPVSLRLPRPGRQPVFRVHIEEGNPL